MGELQPDTDDETGRSKDAPARVLMASTSYPRDADDWRGVFMRPLVEAFGLREDVRIALWAPPGDMPANVTRATTFAEAAWLARLMADGGISHLIRHPRPSTLLAPLALLRMLGSAYRRYPNVDLFHVNWLQCALPLPRNRVPALITVLGNDLKLLRLPMMRVLLRNAMRGRRVAICPNADWMRESLVSAFGDIARVVPVSFGIDPRWYAVSRTPSENRPAWLAVSRLTREKLGPLFEWGERHFANQHRELHLFGPMQEQMTIPAWVHHHGAASPEELASKWFPHAAGLITLSRHAEGRPQVMLEAMAAGLPIIASSMPAHATIVRDGQTGVLCDGVETFGDALRMLEQVPLNRQYGTAARAWATSEVGTWDDCAERYAGVYRQLLAGEADA